jgi:hypothetical protein
MKNLLSKLFVALFPASVDSITARFNQDIEKLKSLAETHRASAELHTTAAHDLLDLADAAHEEADRAIRVAAKVAALID